jgi:hypothetical protein
LSAGDDEGDGGGGSDCSLDPDDPEYKWKAGERRAQEARIFELLEVRFWEVR